MSDKPFLTPLIVQCGGIIAAGAITWGAMSSQVNAITAIIQDHEIRLRTLENMVLVQLGEIRGDIKSEFHGVKLRLTSIERKVGM